MKLVSIPANPAPDDVVCGTLKTRDGILIRYARWAPPPGRKGTVCIFQGRAEFIEKYFEVARDLRARGFAVVAFDWRGQGLSGRMLSDPRKGHVRSFDEYEIDLEAVVKEVVLPDSPPPFYALGHSMGASIVLRAANKHRWFERIVLSTPMFALPPAPWGALRRPIVRTMRLMGMGPAYIPGGSPTVVAAQPFVGNNVTTDPVRHARTAAVIDAEPALGIGSPTVSWAASAFEIMSEFTEPGYAARLRQPVVMVAAGRDDIVSTSAIEDFSMRMRAGSHLIVAGARHELLLEQDRYRAQFWAAFDAFVPGTPTFG
jgi:lysophospholipase